MMEKLKDKNGDWDCKKILMAGGKLTTVNYAVDFLTSGSSETVAVDLINLNGQWFWTLTGNSHCFGPFNSQYAALQDVAR